MAEFGSRAALRPPSLGGFLPLELASPERRSHPHADALAVQSARAAFLLLLRAIRPARVWMPWYLCATMAEQARRAGTHVVHYGLTPVLGVAADVDPSPGDVVLVVNYFGLCDAHVDDALARFGADRVIVDDSQAYFAVPRPCLGTLYSPRKFVGVADGGLLVTHLPIDPPRHADDGSLARLQPILGRLADGPEPHHAAHRAAEQALEGQEPARMSALTTRLLASVDHRRVADRRIANFAMLESALGASNRWSPTRDPAAVPMHYPFLAAGSAARLRQRLEAKRIYPPRFWPHLAEERALPPTDRYFVEQCIALPCDQNCSPEDIERIVSVVREGDDGGE